MKYKLASTKSLVVEMLAHIDKYEYIAYDVESTGLNVRTSKIIGFAVSGFVGEGYYFPIYEWDVEAEVLKHVLIDGVAASTFAPNIVKALIGKKLIMHNGSYDIQITLNDLGVDLLPYLFIDTIVLVHTVREEGLFALKDIAVSIQEEIGFDVESAANEEQLLLKENVKKNGGEVSKTNFELYKGDLSVIWPYAVKDVDLTLRVCKYYWKKLVNEGLQDFFFKDEVMPLLREVTIPMEQSGVKLDIPYIKQIDEDITKDIELYKNKVIEAFKKIPAFRKWVMEKSIEEFPPSNKGNFAQGLVKHYGLDLPVSEKTGKYSLTKKTIEALPDSDVKQYLLTGEDEFLPAKDGVAVSVNLWMEKEGGLVNIQSKKQLGEIAFQYMKIKPLSKTEKGADQFNDDLVDHLAEEYEWARDLRVFNKLIKIKTSYIDRYLERNEDGRYYFYYKQHGTISGRYASDAQQLPRPLEEGEQDAVILKYRNSIRAFFIPEDGYVFIDCDYESLEPKCVCENSLVQTKNGFQYIKDVNIGDFICTKDGWSLILNKSTSNKQGYTIVTTKGSITCSLDHKVFVELRGWVEVKDIKLGDVLVNVEYSDDTAIHPNKLPVYFKDAKEGSTPFATMELTEELSWCIGAFLGDGYGSKGSGSAIGICGLRGDGIIDRFCNYFERYGLNGGVYSDRRTKDMYAIQFHDVWFKQIFNKTLKLVDNENGKILRIPEFIFNSSIDIKLAFFAGIVDTDGTYNDKKSEMSISSKSSYFCNDIILLGRSLGLDGRLGVAHKYSNGLKYQVYQVRFTAISINKLYDLDINKYMSCERKKLKGHRMIGKLKMPHPIVKEIIPTQDGINMVDITVSKNEEFVCNGFRVHNCFSHVASDQGLIDIFLKGWDFYSTIAIKTEKMENVSPDKKADNYLGKVNKPARQLSKSYALGVPYGMKAYALGQSIGVTTKEAEELIEGYLGGFPNLRKWMQESEDHAKAFGWVKNQVGRVRHLPKVKEVYDTFGEDITDWNYRKDLESELGKDAVRGLFLDYINGLNNSRNFQIQSLAASIVNRAAIAINRKFKEVGIDGKVVAQIHDQIIFHVRDNERIHEAADIVKDLMENTTKLSLPLTAPPAIAKNWRDGH